MPEIDDICANLTTFGEKLGEVAKDLPKVKGIKEKIDKINKLRKKPTKDGELRDEEILIKVSEIAGQINSLLDNPALLPLKMAIPGLGPSLETMQGAIRVYVGYKRNASAEKQGSAVFAERLTAAGAAVASAGAGAERNTWKDLLDVELANAVTGIEGVTESQKSDLIESTKREIHITPNESNALLAIDIKRPKGEGADAKVLSIEGVCELVEGGWGSSKASEMGRAVKRGLLKKIPLTPDIPHTRDILYTEPKQPINLPPQEYIESLSLEMLSQLPEKCDLFESKTKEECLKEKIDMFAKAVILDAGIAVDSKAGQEVYEALTDKVTKGISQIRYSASLERKVRDFKRVQTEAREQVVVGGLLLADGVVAAAAEFTGALVTGPLATTLIETIKAPVIKQATMAAKSSQQRMHNALKSIDSATVLRPLTHIRAEDDSLPAPPSGGVTPSKAPETQTPPKTGPKGGRTIMPF